MKATLLRYALALALSCAAPATALADETPIRVSILRHQFQTVVSSEGGMNVQPAGVVSGSPYVAPAVTTVLDIRRNAQGLLLAGVIQADNAIVVTPAGEFPVSVDGRAYRGSVIVQSAGEDALDVINVIDLEQYLYGVVGSEMDPSWPAAALEAQAIVARTYALAHLGTREWLGYDLRAGEQDQAYKGMQAETPSVAAAVDATRGKVLVYGSDLVHAYYSSCDGGYTSRGDALGDPQPYLVSQADPYCRHSPDEQWTVDVPLDTFRTAFTQEFKDVGPIVAVHPGSADSSGRLESVTVLGTLDSVTIPATSFRSLAGNHLVRSTRIASVDVVGVAIRVTGAGFGHGTGMAQWGARGMAEAGKTADDILRFYYRGAAFAQIADRIGHK